MITEAELFAKIDNAAQTVVSKNKARQTALNALRQEVAVIQRELLVLDETVLREMDFKVGNQARIASLREHLKKELRSATEVITTEENNYRQCIHDSVIDPKTSMLQDRFLKAALKDGSDGVIEELQRHQGRYLQHIDTITASIHTSNKEIKSLQQQKEAIQIQQIAKMNQHQNQLATNVYNYHQKFTNDNLPMPEINESTLYSVYDNIIKHLEKSIETDKNDPNANPEDIKAKEKTKSDIQHSLALWMKERTTLKNKTSDIDEDINSARKSIKSQQKKIKSKAGVSASIPAILMYEESMYPTQTNTTLSDNERQQNKEVSSRIDAARGVFFTDSQQTERFIEEEHAKRIYDQIAQKTEAQIETHLAAIPNMPSAADKPTNDEVSKMQKFIESSMPIGQYYRPGSSIGLVAETTVAKYHQNFSEKESWAPTSRDSSNKAAMWDIDTPTEIYTSAESRKNQQVTRKKEYIQDRFKMLKEKKQAQRRASAEGLNPTPPNQQGEAPMNEGQNQDALAKARAFMERERESQKAEIQERLNRSREVIQAAKEARANAQLKTSAQIRDEAALELLKEKRPASQRPQTPSPPAGRKPTVPRPQTAKPKKGPSSGRSGTRTFIPSGGVKKQPQKTDGPHKPTPPPKKPGSRGPRR